MTDETQAPDEGEGWTRDERAALAAWTAPAAPPDFAARALERAARQVRTRRLGWVLAAAALAVVGVGLALAWPRGESVTGRIEATARTTVALGARAVAVVEPGAELVWQVDSDGAADLEQRRGAAFYRVERGGAFVVKVPTGEVRVRGTCFKVEVVAMKQAGAAGLGVVAGALVTTVVWVTVYEGKVEAVRGADVQVVMPGERAMMQPETISVGPAAAALGPDTTDLASSARPDDPRTGRGANARGAVADPGRCASELAAVQSDAKALTAKVATLETQLSHATEAAAHAGRKTYDLPQAELDAMAQACELGWDTLPFRIGQPPTVPESDAEAFGLTAAQVERVNAILASENQLLVDTIRSAYVQVTGDDPQAILAVAPTALFDEIEDKTSREETRRIFQRLALDRAAHVAPITDPHALAGLPPTEQVWRVLTSSGDRLEAKLAEVFGADAAHRMRDAHQGFGSSSRSSHGCPETAP